MVGYTGGDKPWPTYQSIQDHTEAVRIEFNPDRITYRDILDVIFKSASPFSKSWSMQYQSGVWWLDEEQRSVINQKVKEVEERTSKKVKMEISKAKKFYRA
mmetsp:Transcript_940/g.1125  ORF Transcript_940/g.1125 Transcript_940/m.1125 type:complete len:101 (+) Transcript_940:262-564(+)